MSTVNKWQLTPVADIEWVPGLLFKRPDSTGTLFKITNFPAAFGYINWDYADNRTPAKYTTKISKLSSKWYLIKPSQVFITKEEKVIKKIKELDLRYANRRANL